MKSNALRIAGGIGIRTAQTLSLLFIACTGARAADRTVDTVNAAAARDPIVAHPLREGITELEGSGGNITVLSGSDGKFMVDSGIAVSKSKIKAALDALGSASVKYVVNTHWHWDHADGDAWLHADGATIIATPKTVEYLTRASRVDEWEHTFPPVAEGGVPTEILTAGKVYRLDGETIVVNPLKPSHTDGDLFVYFKKGDVLATGDAFWNGHYPFIDNGHGGGINGTIAAIEGFLRLATDRTLIVPGHGPVGNRAQLREYLRMLISVRDKIRVLKTQGKSLTEVIAANPTASFDAKWGTFIITPSRFTAVVYQGV
jgi:glyoxylase-like metal-dependent hydrolase (beta-lactamase superfamily II)